MVTASEVKPEPSLIDQEKDCVCPSFSLPVEPPRVMVGGVVSSSVTVTVRLVEVLAPSPLQSLSASVAATVSLNTPRPNESKLKLLLASLSLVVLKIVVGPLPVSCVMVTAREANPKASLACQVNC